MPFHVSPQIAKHLSITESLQNPLWSNEKFCFREKEVRSSSSASLKTVQMPSKEILECTFPQEGNRADEVTVSEAQNVGAQCYLSYEQCSSYFKTIPSTIFWTLLSGLPDSHHSRTSLTEVQRCSFWSNGRNLLSLQKIMLSSERREDSGRRAKYWIRDLKEKFILNVW